MIRMKLLEKVTLVKLCRIPSICIYIIVRYSYANGLMVDFEIMEHYTAPHVERNTTSRPPGSSSCQADIVQ